MAASQSMMPRQRSSDIFRPRPPTLSHAGSYGRRTGSICFAWLLLAVCIHVESAESSTVPVLVVRQNCSTRALGDQDMATQDLIEAVVSHPGAEVIRGLPVVPTTETSAPATEGSEATPTTRPHSDDGQIPPASTPSLAHPHTALLDEAAVSVSQNLSGEEKGRRLIEAAKEGSVSELKALLAAGADVGTKDEDEWTALHHAAEEGHVEAARCLLQAGAEVEARSTWHSTPLHVAAKYGHTAVVRLLLGSSANPNARDKWRWTPLHWAAANGDAEVATALLEAGADKGATNVWGRTPLDFARDNNQQQLIQMLETD